MEVKKTDLPGLLIVEPQVFGDKRGFFMETFHKAKFSKFGINVDFVQENHSRSIKNTLRGLHFQTGKLAQGKLVRVVLGDVFDVAVDCRKTSPTFGKWVGLTLSAENHLQMYVPPGFAHGFCVLSDFAELVYLCTNFYSPDHEGGIIWNDPALAIPWPVENPIISNKDKHLPKFSSLANS